MKSIIFAMMVIYASLVYISKPVELSGHDEMVRAIKNYK
jgi:hypothetical protein